MRQTKQLWTVHSIGRSNNICRVWHLSLTLSLGMLAAIAAPMIAETWEPAAEEQLQLGPIENPSSPLPPRGYQSRPCGFDLNHNGIIGEPADCNVCDASIVGGKIVANTSDPDGDGVEEDLIYVDCDDGSNFNYCGRPGFRPCGTIEYAWENIANGPEGGAEDIVCFTGICSPDNLSLPEEFNGVPGHWTKPPSGSETREWQFSSDPAILSGWDTDNDQQFPPYDTDDNSVLDGVGLSRALLLNSGGPNSFYEIAHFEAKDYGSHDPSAEGGGFINMFRVTLSSTHGHVHDLVLTNINKDGGLHGSNITFPWYNAAYSSHIAVTNIKSIDEGGYTFRGNASLKGEVTAGPWRFQNLTITAHGCDDRLCDGRAAKTGWKLWGWADGIEVLDSVVDGNVSAWSPHSLVGIYINAHTKDWDIINNELIDWSVAIVADGALPDAYTFAKRYTDDIVISRNLIRNDKQDRNLSIMVAGSGGDKQALRDIWILNNVLTSSLSPKSHVLIRQGNTEGPCVTNVRIFNNTFFGKADDTIKVSDPGTDFRAERVHFKNNIVAGQNPEGRTLKIEYPLNLWDSDYNALDSRANLQMAGVDFSSLLDWRAATGGDSHSLGCQPAFKAPPFDLHLASNDVCAQEKADELSYVTTTDSENDLRPYGKRWDIGADEWNGGFFWDSLETGSLSRWSDSVP